MIRLRGLFRPFSAAVVVLVTAIALPGTSRAQVSDAELSALIQGIEADSMRAMLEILTGQRTVYIGDSVNTEEGGWLYDRTVKVYNRVWLSNDVAALVIRNRLASYGLETWVHHPADSVKNVLARIEGATEPGRQVMLGAHYDAVSGAPGADDNGSGTAAVVEIARLLSGLKPDRTIIFGLWDAEEIGLVGSTLYAQEARARGDDIEAVINLDMIGWNTGEPDLLVATTSTYSNSALKARMLTLASTLELPLNAGGFVMGRSDHVSFSNAGYPSVMLIEDYLDDFNEFYHTSNDVMAHIDFDYMTAITRLAAAGVVWHAFDSLTRVGREELPVAGRFDVTPYPNPARNRVRFDVDGPVRIEVFDVLGRKVARVAGVDVDVSHLSSGIYAYRIERPGEWASGVLAVGR